jgi:hypothetical protein
LWFFAGSEFCEEAFVVKVKLEIVVSQDQVLLIMKPPALDSSG